MNSKIGIASALASLALFGCTQTDGDANGSGAAHAAAPEANETGSPPPATMPEASGTPEPATTAPASAPSPVAYTLCASGLPTSGMWKCDPVLADVNADGHVDLVAVPRLGRGPRVWLGDGAGNWRDSSEGLDPGTGSCGGGVGVADVDMDGDADIVVGDHCHGIYVYLGDGTGQWEKVVDGLFPTQLVGDDTVIEHWTGAEDIACADVNGDGFPDLVAAASDYGGVNVYHGDGTGRNWKWSALSPTPEGWAVRVVLADLNGDDLPDIIASHSDGPRAWLNEGDNGWGEMNDGLPSPMIRGIYQAMAAADMNGDGRTDIIVANWYDGPEVYFQQEGGWWLKAEDVFPGMLGGATGIAVGDIDQDGHQDIAVAGRTTLGKGFSRGVYLLTGQGEGRWTFHADSGLPGTGLAATPGVAIGDVNADGVPDVIACTGLKVESNPKDPSAPTIAEQVIVFCGKRR